MRRKFLVSTAAAGALALPLLAMLPTPERPAGETPAVGGAVPEAAAPSAGVVSESMVSPTRFLQPFDGLPAAPLPWAPNDWDVTVHSRNHDYWDTIEPMVADHGADCSGPSFGGHHQTTGDYADSVFLCRDHMMTAIHGTDYAAVYLTPAAMVDFSGGEAVVRLDISTVRTSARDWWDIWITPYDQNLQVPFDADGPDFNGPPRNAIHVRMKFLDNEFEATIYRDGREEELGGGPEYDSWIPRAEQVPGMRDTFELRISETALNFSMPEYGQTMTSGTYAPLGWNTGVVQFGHHSYNPEKGCNSDSPCHANTWHWDNMEINPAIPFTLINGDRRGVTGDGPQTISFGTPAPADAHLRFAAIGENIELSYDGGKSWQPAQLQDHPWGVNHREHFRSYWTPVPAGTSKVLVRAESFTNWGWYLRSPSIWSDNGRATPSGNSGRPPAPAPTPDNPQPGGADGGPRLLDTRPGAPTHDGTASGIGVQAPGAVVELQVTGRAGVPADAHSVALNLTTDASHGTGYITAWPCGEPQPYASSLNFVAGRPVANSTIVRVGAGGKVCLATSQSATHLLADVGGWFVDDTFVARTPARILDTRPGIATVDGVSSGDGMRGPGNIFELQVTGRAGVPADAHSVALNLTTDASSGTGYITAWPCGEPQPYASSLNFVAGRPVANAAIVRVGAGGKVCLFTAEAATHVIADVSGWFAADGYRAQAPDRLLDTRPTGTTVDGGGIREGARAGGSVYELVLAGRAGVPADARAVALNLTADGASGIGYVTAWPCGEPRPNASNLNFAPGGPVANSAIVELGAKGAVCLFVGDASAHLIADVSGWMTPSSGFVPV